jgi:hypothetical protein
MFDKVSGLVNKGKKKKEDDPLDNLEQEIMDEINKAE